jgi:tagatose 6-phosphate kinase
MILVVGLSPAWQRTLCFERLQPGQVNRARRVTETASGKGVNVARVATALGAPVRLLTVAGGPRGQQLVEALRAERIDARVVRVASQTRLCQTLLSGGRATELVEESGRLTARELARVRALFRQQLRRARLVVLTGTVPPGCGEDFYARLAREARARRVPVLVDAQRRQLMNALRARPFLVRVNRQELAAGWRGKPAEMLGRGVQALVVSDGANPVRVWSVAGSWAVVPPRVKVVNPIGSGDAMLAGIAVALWRGAGLAEAVRLGVACAVANVLTERPGQVRLLEVKRIFRRLAGFRAASVTSDISSTRCC